MAHQSTDSSLGSTPRKAYHALHPHPALDPVPDPSDASSVSEQESNEQAWRQLLAQNVLAVLLPTEDLQNDCLKALVEQILAEMIVGNIIGNRLCENWAVWELITNGIEATRTRGDTSSFRTKKTGPGSESQRSKKKDDKPQTESNQTPTKGGIGRLEHFGLVNTPIQSESESETSNKRSMPKSRARYCGQTARSLTITFWAILQYGFVLITTGRAVALLLISSAKLPMRGSSTVVNGIGVSASAERTEGAARSGIAKASRPIVDMTVWKTAGNLMELQTRMPWLSGLASLMHWTVTAGPGRVGETDGKIDR
jgi:PXA domain-containing protein